MRWARGGWEVGAEGHGRCKTEPSKSSLSPAHAEHPAHASPLSYPRPLSPQHQLQRRALGAVGLCAGEINFGKFPHSALGTDNSSSKCALPRHLVPIPPTRPFPLHSPFPLLKNSEDPGLRKKPAPHGAEWAPGLPAGKRPPPHPDVNVRCSPASRLRSDSVYTSVSPSLPNQKSLSCEFDFKTLQEEKPQNLASPPPPNILEPQTPQNRIRNRLTLLDYAKNPNLYWPQVCLFSKGKKSYLTNKQAAFP